MKVQDLIRELQKYQTNGEVVIGISTDMLYHINLAFTKGVIGVKMSVTMADEVESADLGLDIVPVVTTIEAIY